MIQKMIAKITSGPLVLFFSVVVFFTVIFVVVLTVLFMLVSAVAA